MNTAYFEQVIASAVGIEGWVDQRTSWLLLCCGLRVSMPVLPCRAPEVHYKAHAVAFVFVILGVLQVLKACTHPALGFCAELLSSFHMSCATRYEYRQSGSNYHGLGSDCPSAATLSCRTCSVGCRRLGLPGPRPLCLVPNVYRPVVHRHFFQHASAWRLYCRLPCITAGANSIRTAKRQVGAWQAAASSCRPYCRGHAVCSDSWLLLASPTGDAKNSRKPIGSRPS